MTVQVEALTYEALKAKCDHLEQINAQTLQVKLKMAETIKELTDRVNALAVENAAMKESRQRLAEFIHEELDADYPLNLEGETPATDAALSAIEARTERNENLMRFVVEVFNIAAQHCTLNRDEIHKLGQSLGLFASKEFGQETHWQLDGIFQDNSCGHAINHDKSIGIEMFANFCREKAVSSKTSYARSFWSKCGFQASIYAKKLREAK